MVERNELGQQKIDFANWCMGRCRPGFAGCQWRGNGIDWLELKKKCQILGKLKGKVVLHENKEKGAGKRKVQKSAKVVKKKKNVIKTRGHINVKRKVSNKKKSGNKKIGKRA